MTLVKGESYETELGHKATVITNPDIERNVVIEHEYKNGNKRYLAHNVITGIPEIEEYQGSHNIKIVEREKEPKEKTDGTPPIIKEIMSQIERASGNSQREALAARFLHAEISMNGLQDDAEVITNDVKLAFAYADAFIEKTKLAKSK